jgi:hypothetical protein
VDEQQACSVAGCDKLAVGVAKLSPPHGATRPVPGGAPDPRPLCTEHLEQARRGELGAG